MKNISFVPYICFLSIFLFFGVYVFLNRGEGKRAKLDQFSGVSYAALAAVAAYVRADCCSENLNC